MVTSGTACTLYIQKRIAEVEAAAEDARLEARFTR